MSKIGSSLSIDNVENFEGLIKNFKVDSFSKNSVLFNDNDLLRMNSKNLKELSSEELKQNFKFNCDEKFWQIIRGNVEQFDEIQEWYNIVSKGINTKVAVDKKLLDLIKISIPEKIDLPPQIQAVIHKEKVATFIKNYTEFKSLLLKL